MRATEKANSQSWPNLPARRGMEPVLKWFKGLLGPIYAQWHEKGRRDGLEWARSKAARNELRYAATEFRTQQERGKLVSYNPTKDGVIGPVFEGVFARYHFSWEKTEPYAYIPEGRYLEWEQGFADAVREYWEEVKK